MKGKLYTSYFSNIDNGIGLKISIALYNPNWCIDKIDSFIKQLAPNELLLKLYKDNKITWEDYKKGYLAQLQVNNKGILELQKLLNNGKDVTIYCYEKDFINCHRSIIAELFRKLGYEVIEI